MSAAWVQMHDGLIPAEQARVSVFDRGFMYGDGAFETMRAYRGKVFRLDAHLRRLVHSAARLQIRVPFDANEVTSHIRDVLKKNELDDAVVRVSVSRGVGQRGAAIDPSSRPTYLVTADLLPANLAERENRGISLAIANIRRVPAASLPADAKHSNYLNSILANAEAVAAGADEALILSVDGEVAECATGNIFFVRGPEILTPSLETGILPGITRATVLELARVHEMRLTPDILSSADEVLMTNSVVGILPVRRVDSLDFPVNGPRTARLRESYRALIEA